MRRGFALLLKFFELEGRSPRDRGELRAPVVEYVAGLVKVPAAELARYSWSGRTIEYHRSQIRRELGFRKAFRHDARRGRRRPRRLELTDVDLDEIAAAIERTGAGSGPIGPETRAAAH